MELEGIHSKRPKNKPFFAVKNFSSGGIFLSTLFFAVEKRVDGSKGFESKTIRDDGAKRALIFCNRVEACNGTYRHPWLFSLSMLAVRLTFCLQRQKVSKKEIKGSNKRVRVKLKD
ncbi:MAG: hypothetical protein ACI936_000564 [Paraglaciecola sp.]